MVQHQYLVILTPQEEGGFTVTVPALPGCISEGDTKKKALINIKDAIEGYLLVARRHNLPLFTGVQEIVQVKIASGILKDSKTSAS